MRLRPGVVVLRKHRLAQALPSPRLAELRAGHRLLEVDRPVLHLEDRDHDELLLLREPPLGEPVRLALLAEPPDDRHDLILGLDRPHPVDDLVGLALHHPHMRHVEHHDVAAAVVRDVLRGVGRVAAVHVAAVHGAEVREGHALGVLVRVEGGHRLGLGLRPQGLVLPALLVGESLLAGGLVLRCDLRRLVLGFVHPTVSRPRLCRAWWLASISLGRATPPPAGSAAGTRTPLPAAVTRACEHVTPAPFAAAVRTYTHRPLRSLGISRTAESNRADGTVTSPRGPTVRPMARMIHPRGRNCQGRILEKIIFEEREKGERERFWSIPPRGASREPRGSQRGQSVWERDCIGTGSGRGGNPRLFGRMGWGWGGGARFGVGRRR